MLKQKTPLQRKTPMKPGTKPMQAKKPMNRGSGFKPQLRLVPVEPAVDTPPKLPPKPPKPRSRLKASKPQASPAERTYMDLVAKLGCIVCKVCLGIEGTPAEVHHVRTGQGKKRACHYNTISLCPAHHNFHRTSLHVLGVRQFAIEYGISEIQLLIIVQDQLRAYLPPDHAPPGDPYAVPEPQVYFANIADGAL